MFNQDGTPGSPGNKRNDKLFNTIGQQRRVPIIFIFVLLALYFVTYAMIGRVSGNKDLIVIGNMSIPSASFSGVFSALSNGCIVLIALLYGRLGFFTSLFIMLAQFPGLIINIVRNHAYASIPGIFSNLLTFVMVVIIFVNFLRVERYQKRMSLQAVTDRLTGLPNRFGCTEYIGELARSKEKFAAVSIDMNNFKSVNDTMGHSAGNEVLKTVAERWREMAENGTTGTMDFVARMSGDEFTLIIRNYTSEEMLLKTIRAYAESIEQRITIDGCDLFMSAGFGWAEYPKDTTDLETLMTYCDAALQEVKRSNSSNHILRFAPEMLKVEHTLEIERKIRTALDNDGVFFNLQPQFDLSHKLRGFEALARMRDEDGSIISPGEFIPVAEKVGLIDKVDACVFRKSAMFLGNLLKENKVDITLSVNVSVRHMMKNDFLDEVRQVIAESGIPADHLEIEITESIMIDSAEKALQCINEIKNMGIQIAIDDFGTGYSSLSYLNKFPATLLKVDKSFIDKMNSGESSKQYVAAIISIGHIMKFDVIAEGVEEPAQLETLRSIGCDYIQGFIWGRPLPPETAEKLVVEAAKAS